MVKMTRVASVTTLAGLALGMWMLAAQSPAEAKTTSDQAAAILYWPKVVVDSANHTDTLIRLSNTNTSLQKQAHCYYIDANSHCSNNPSQVCNGSCSGAGVCLQGWGEIDFDIVITRDQPLAWHASSGMHHGQFPLEVPGVCKLGPPFPCSADFQCPAGPGGGCLLLPNNIGSGIPPVAEDPFVGALICVQYDPSANPPAPDQSLTTGNALIGEATIERAIPAAAPAPAGVDLASYNAVGVRYKGGVETVPPGELHLDGVQYESCPTTLILDHQFDVVTGTEQQVTDLTLVPCGNNFLTQTPGSVTAQFVIFNEFEQRFSTSNGVDCFFDKQLSRIDTVDPSRSIFTSSQAGTAVGQTRIRPVSSAATGRGVLGVAVYRQLGPTGLVGDAAYDLHQSGSLAPGSGTQPDVITIP
ncbi:MAG: hypothetical protein ACHQ9S_16555 [Candidatus Binatia bacterium]